MKLPNNLPAIFVTTLLVLGAGVVLWKAVAPEKSTALVRVTVPTLSNTAAAGKQAFDKLCRACHGDNGAGSDRGPPLVQDIYQPGHHADEAFFRAAKNGVPQHHWSFGNMPPRPDATQQELAFIVQYIRELQLANGIVWRPHRM